MATHLSKLGLLAVVATVALALIAVRPKLSADEAIHRFGEPLAVADSYDVGQVQGSKALMHNREVRLHGLRAFNIRTAIPGDVWIYSDDSRVHVHLESVLIGQFARNGDFPFALSPAAELRLLTLAKDNRIDRNVRESCYFLLLNRQP